MRCRHPGAREQLFYSALLYIMRIWLTVSGVSNAKVTPDANSRVTAYHCNSMVIYTFLAQMTDKF